MIQKNLHRLVRNVEAHGDRFTDPCACGCGEPVRIGVSKPQQYVNRQHQAWDKNYAALSLIANMAKTKDNIPIEQFRVAIKKLKAQKGWTYAQMAELGGQQPGWLHSYMYSDKQHTIGRRVATAFLSRLAGISTVATKHEQRVAPAHVKKVNQTIKQLDLDPTPKPYQIPYWSQYGESSRSKTRRLSS